MNKLRDFWLDYKEEFFFFLLCLVATFLSYYLGSFIPAPVYDNILTPVFNTCTVVISFFGAWILFRHSGGIRARKLFACALIVWGVSDLIYLVGWATAPQQVMNMSAYELTVHELVLGNILGWVLLMYPTEALRPGWLNWKRVLWQLLPLVALMVIDHFLPVNLWPVIALYPYLLLLLLINHLRVYKKWCEDNFSRLDDIDVRWLIRYFIMLLFIGANYVWMCSSHDHNRGFTQQWFVVMVFIYSVDQILFHRNPWRILEDGETVPDPASGTALSAEMQGETPSPDKIRALEQWMRDSKPYLNPDFQLTDMNKVLHTNRTRLSNLINNACGCTFYQLVNRYRVEEAQRIMAANPDMRMSDVATACGFSSPAVFSRTFARVTGLSPRDWYSHEWYSREFSSHDSSSHESSPRP